MLTIQVPAQVQQPAEGTVELVVALARVLDEYDLKGEGAALARPNVPLQDAPALRWLLEALAKDLPDNPFPPGSRAHAEAEALRALLREANPAPTTLDARIARLGLGETGSRMALWRWGRRLARAGRLPAAIRRLWEDKLLSVPEPTLASSYALRHALSFALAEGDLGRFADLKADHAADSPDLVLGFQRLFGLIGSAGPRLNLWTLPGLRPVQVYLKDLGKDRIWICPAGASDSPPAGVAWVLPSRAGNLQEAAPALDEDARREAESLAKSLPADGAWFAPSREDFEAHGFGIFPILVQLDFRGHITAIRLGEAAPEKP